MTRPAPQRGYILLPVIVVITLVAAIALLMTTESALESNTAASELDARQAQYVAAAGLNHALWLTQRQGCGPYSNITNWALGNDRYNTSLSTDLGATTAYSLAVSQDAWIGSFQTSLNHGNDATLHVSQSGGDSETALLRFDLSSLPAGAAILSATAWFHVNTEHPQGPLELHRLTADWGESDATWDSMGANLDDAVVASIPPQAAAGNRVPVNLTSQVQAWVNGEPNFGLALVAEIDGIDAGYSSRESTDAPYVEIVVGAPPTSPALLKAQGTLANGTSRGISRADVTLRQQPGFALLQPDAAAGKDTYLYEWKPTWNYGVSNDIWVDDRFADSTANGLIRFDLGAIPAGARVKGARLELYRVNPSLGGGPIGVYAVGADWDEGTKSGGIGESSWNQRKAAQAWANAGGDFGSARYALETVPAGTGWSEWEIGELVDTWISGRLPNEGLALLPETAGTAAHFASSDATDPSLRPRLSVEYACECGQVCVAPQGSGKLLMVVVNPTTLVPEDQQAKDLFESWGYTVSVISESANQATFDAGFAANDVVFISETVNAMQVGAKTASAPIGVVSQDGDYNPDLGLASGSAHPVGDSINVTDNSHYITQPFAAGSLEIYTHAMEQLTSSGSLNADQQQLADSGGVAALIALDRGAAMEGGGNAAGRRVMLPLGTRYRFDWDYLNANGRLLVQRALAWGIGADKTSAGDVLLVVPNPAALGAADAARQALIESWDFSVTLIDDSDTQAAFDVAVAASDVVYVSAMADIVALAAKLDAVPTGVVFEPSELSQNFGLADISNKGTNTNQISIVDNTHYITEPFALGAVTISDTALKPTVLLGTLAPGMSTLANNSGQTSMSALDIGAARYDAAPSPGRRAMLPWGEAVFDPAWLNADGETLMRRAIEWGAGLTLPPPVQQLLFVVPSPGSLGPADSAKLALFESWGYTVNQIDDDAPLSDYQAAIGANSVAYVAATAVANSVGSKLFKAGIGVVNANTGLHDDFGFSTVRFVASTNASLNTIANHYITQPFGGGQATLYTSDQPSGGAVGTLAADLDQIGSWSSGALSPLGGLVTLDAGAMTSIGEVASGRRAQMPWDSLDVSTLSADGLTILQRSLEWAEGANIDLSPYAHWKLDETSGFTAVDSEGSHDGTLTNFSAPAWTAGVVDGGLDFDGSNDYVDAGTFDVVGSGITLMAWFNAEAIATDDGRFVSKASGPNEADAWWQLSTTDSGSNRYLRMRIRAGGTTTTLADSSVNLSTGQWYLATATYDNASGEMKLYLDGVEVASRAHAVGGALDTNPAVPVALGANGTAERFFNGILDDVRVYNRALDATEIQDYYDASAPQPPGYTEVYEPWTAASDSTWEAVDLVPLGVPTGAVVEVAVVQADAAKEQWGGVRAVGSALERRILLHESESGGVDSVTMHVQADASGRIEHYTSKKGTTSFVLLGYWTGVAYVELFEPFGANASNAWVVEGVDDEGLGPDQIAEVLMQNINESAERLAGVRAAGSSINRRFDLHEAEAGGVDAVTMMVETDAASSIEAYAEDTVDVEFYVLGYWSRPPGSFIELGGTSARSTPSAAWGIKNISSLGVPADSITQFVLSNDATGAENAMGVRAVGSTQDRFVSLQEAESGGSDLATMHAHVDANTEVEWYSESGISGAFFYPVGAWLLAP